MKLSGVILNPVNHVNPVKFLNVIKALRNSGRHEKIFLYS
jgi:hypothetical protein